MADFGPPRIYDDNDGMQSSPGRSQHGYSREDAPMTDQTDDDGYEDDDDQEAEFEMYRVQGTLREWCVLEVMEDVAKNVVFSLHTNYKRIRQKIYVRITNWPVYDQISNIQQTHLNTMIHIGGVVTRRSGVFLQLQQVKYDCNKCGAILGPFLQNSYSEVKVGSCPECQSKGPFNVNIEQFFYALIFFFFTFWGPVISSRTQSPELLQ
ncbi:PREDICTED: DNA replication licensing factor [Prunus dulcis]|nr:PREDICTED: DNA replication licensing factor [Prunus dulcis]